MSKFNKVKYARSFDHGHITDHLRRPLQTPGDPQAPAAPVSQSRVQLAMPQLPGTFVPLLKPVLNIREHKRIPSHRFAIGCRPVGPK
jgi:hypothetical protein